MVCYVRVAVDVLLVVLVVLIEYFPRQCEARCFSAECSIANRYLNAFIDRAVDPCADFYKFLCGKIRQGKESIMEEEAVLEKENRITRTMKERIDRADGSSPAWLRAAQTFQRSCERASISRVPELISIYQQLSSLAIEDYLSEISKRFAIGVFFDIQYSTVRLNSIDVLERDGFLDAEWFLRRKMSKKMGRYYGVHRSIADKQIRNSMALVKDANLSITLEQIFRMEERILPFRHLEEDVEPARFVTYSFEKFSRFYSMPTFNWARYFARWKSSFNESSTVISVQNRLYLVIVMRLLDEPDTHKSIREYAFLLAVNNLLKKYLFLGMKYESEEEQLEELRIDNFPRDFYGETERTFQTSKAMKSGKHFTTYRAFEGANQTMLCLAVTVNVFTPLSLQTYARFIPPSIIETFDAVVKAVIPKAHQMVKESEWLSEEEKKLFLEKLLTLEIYPIYPAYLLDDKTVETLFGHFEGTLNDDWTTNVLSVVAYWGQHLLTPQTVTLNPPPGPFYWRFKNVISMQFGPVWDEFVPLLEESPSRPSFIALARMCSVLAHEIGHMLDTTAWSFFANLTFRPRSSWSKAFRNKLDAQTKCFVDMYRDYDIVNGVPLSGQQTRNENIADAIGLKLGLQAFMEVVKAQYPRPLSSTYSADSLFFIAVGTAPLYCRYPDDTDEFELLNSMLHSRHTNVMNRLNGMTYASVEFAKAFGCCPNTAICPHQALCEPCLLP